eukprot:Nitzschia sp. Nitz4//scaffold330_size19141//17999//18577//NITZ4_008749-RA/size19141-processed-gene-0.15-mRNA-1//1//CDS//3329548169//4367//frame0
MNNNNNHININEVYLVQVLETLEAAFSSLHDSGDHGVLPQQAKPSNSSLGYPIRPIVELPHLGHVTKKRFNSSNNEHCLLETSSNSIRLSFCFKQQHSSETTSTALDKTILSRYMHFFQQRADSFHILRRKPVGGYSISFLILHKHMERFGSDQILQTISQFLQAMDKECSHVKISINARARLVALEFLKAF